MINKKMAKLPTLTLLAALSAGCTNVEQVPVSDHLSAEAAHGSIDISAYIGYPRNCDELDAKFREQALFFINDTGATVEGDTLTLSDEKTLVSMIKSDVVDGVREITLEFSRVNPEEPIPEGAFVGKLILTCIAEESK